MPVSTHKKTSNNGQVYELNILNDNLFRLTGDPVEGNQPGRNPTLSISFAKNRIEFNVFVNNGKPAKEGGMLKYDFDLPTINAMLVMLEDAVRRKEPGFYSVSYMRRVWDKANNRMGEPFSDAIIVIGKDKDGFEIIGIQPRKGPRLQFRFTNTSDRPVIDLATQNPVDPHVVSSLYCRGLINFFKFVIPYIAVNTWDYNKTAEGVREAKKATQGSNNGGGYNQGGYQGGYQQNQPPAQAAPQPVTEAQSQDAFSNAFDDIPF